MTSSPRLPPSTPPRSASPLQLIDHDSPLSFANLTISQPPLLDTPLDETPLQRPLTPRRPSPPLPSTPPHSSPNLHPTTQPRPRPRSPYSRPRAPTSTPMVRAHSSPALSSPISTLRPPSPLRSPLRTRSPLRGEEWPAPITGNHPHAPLAGSEISSISEDAELELTPRDPPSPYHGHTFPRRRRPASPLSGGLGSAPPPAAGGLGASLLAAPTSAPQSASASPVFGGGRGKFDEAFGGDLGYVYARSASSSMPSTPTSVRSRSPSISSLETIPDSPDAEEAAVEQERLERGRQVLRGEEPRRGSLDGRGGGGFGRDKRKRWSVCGAEKRGDLNLETIWED
ncbi:hypothetical protein EJ06DRAFT_130072 [Trichodelitschia bisporula]|uniref:Basic proline-rich protein n=1 Tax=Trichodelitschia bisporula TaxID=703511 RepID=A0A6G1HNQ3_9PEZI|nr:hypothetical protein EJ06DRAFT_130072 [Trichodelitschia bisporula]